MRHGHEHVGTSRGDYQSKYHVRNYEQWAPEERKRQKKHVRNLAGRVVAQYQRQVQAMARQRPRNLRDVLVPGFAQAVQASRPRIRRFPGARPDWNVEPSRPVRLRPSVGPSGAAPVYEPSLHRLVGLPSPDSSPRQHRSSSEFSEIASMNVDDGHPSRGSPGANGLLLGQGAQERSSGGHPSLRLPRPRSPVSSQSADEKSDGSGASAIAEILGSIHNSHSPRNGHVDFPSMEAQEASSSGHGAGKGA